MMPNFLDLFTKDVQLLDLIANDEHGTTKLHAVRLSDGKIFTIDSKMWIMMLHFGNAYQPDDNTIVLEGPAYTKADGDPYTIYMHDYLQSIEGITSHNLGNVYTRFTLHLDTLTMEREDLLKSEYGSFDLPQYNHKLEGVARNRYTFLFHQFWQTTIDETYKWPIVKYDGDEKKIVAEYGPNMTVTQEPRFIYNPDGAEDEGFILFHQYDIKEQASSIVVIDAKNFEKVQEYKLPFKLSI